MINEKFVKDTDQLIQAFKERNVKIHSGNMIIAKVALDRVTKGGLLLSDSHVELEEYKQGFGRILAMADESNQFKVGDYIIFSHEARYKPYINAVREFLGIEVPDNMVYAVQDNEPIMSREEA